MDIALPSTVAEILPFAAAAVTVVLGVLALFVPSLALRALRLTTQPLHSEAVAEIRGTIGGFYIGSGILALLLFDQPVTQMTLGGAWAFAAFGRLVSILSDDGSTPLNWSLLVVSLALAAMPLAAAFGFVGS